VDDLERRAGGDRQDRCEAWLGKARRDQFGLSPSDLGQRRIGLALEATLGDVCRFAVADEDERRVEPVGDEGRDRGRVRPGPGGRVGARRQ
jgi:hypothetical protein